MQKLKVFLVLTGYQLTWLACVFGETKFSNPMLGIWVGIIFLLTYFYFNHNKPKFIKISLLISVPGYFFDTLLVYFQIYDFETIAKFGTLPFWMIVLWLSFSTLFDEILTFFKSYKILGILANFSLCINLILLIAVLSIFEATLTLPGIAGIILTVGMAVDLSLIHI